MTGQDHDHAIEAERNPTMRWRPIFQRFEKESEFLARFLFAEAETLENPRLDIAAVNSDRTAADLRAI